MLYSVTYIENRKEERRMFYANSDKEAMEIIRNYAKRRGIRFEDMQMQLHPKGLRVGSRFYAPEERKNHA